MERASILGGMAAQAGHAGYAEPLDLTIPLPPISSAVAKLNEMIGHAGDLAGVTSKIADDLHGEEEKMQPHGVSDERPTHGGGRLGILLDTIDELYARMMLIDRNVNRIRP